MINKGLKKLVSLIANTSPRMYATVLNATEEYIEYTNGYYLIRIPNTGNLKGRYSKKEMKKELIVEGSAQGSIITYPDTDRVIFENTKPIFCCNGNMLKDMLAVVSADSKDNLVYFEIDDNGGIKIKCKDNLAILASVKSEK